MRVRGRRVLFHAIKSLRRGGLLCVNDNTNIGIDIVGWARYGKPTDRLVSHNSSHNNSTLAPWASEIYLDGPEDIIVEHDIVTGSEFGFQFGCEPATDP